MGVLDNKGTKATGLFCTDVNVVSKADCEKAITPLTIPAEAICLRWPDRENNVCAGDYGGKKI